MAGKIIQLFNWLRTKKYYPQTVTAAVYDDNGERLDNRLEEIDNAISTTNADLKGLKIHYVVGTTPANNNTMSITIPSEFSDGFVIAFLVRYQGSSNMVAVDNDRVGVNINGTKIEISVSSSYYANQPYRLVIGKCNV